MGAVIAQSVFLTSKTLSLSVVAPVISCHAEILNKLCLFITYPLFQFTGATKMEILLNYPGLQAVRKHDSPMQQSVREYKGLLFVNVSCNFQEVKTVEDCRLSLFQVL